LPPPSAEPAALSRPILDDDDGDANSSYGSASLSSEYIGGGDGDSFGMENDVCTQCMELGAWAPLAGVASVAKRHAGHAAPLRTG